MGVKPVFADRPPAQQTRNSKRDRAVGLGLRPATGGNPMGFIPNFYELKETAEESLHLLQRAVAALEKLAAEQERANDLYAEANQLALEPIEVTELQA
ncbi:hypothetical protein [Mycolicibacterium hassiacum]|nr:hypothetical protein [Mycolicibacterium hassiacum]MBX5485786.1 hypothetical protein [Mycolicibacterium hassiacum]MDA4085528.1 hypothetical protein [Mycolicibacterium hassiacum DSM 44199]